MALRSRRSFILFGVGDAGFFSDNSRSARKSEVTYSREIDRISSPLPASVDGRDGRTVFNKKCVGCLLCIQACPRSVLHIDGKSKVSIRPSMDFRYGWCFPECSRCAEICPTGALGKPIRAEDKLKRRAGVAILDQTKCLASRGVKCNACLRHCPVRAISHDDKGVPVVDANKCCGCGSCEYHCPARPIVAIHVEGL